MIRLVCIVEVDGARTIDEAQRALDRFRESVRPYMEYGVTIYRASEEDADAAHYADADEDTGPNEDEPYETERDRDRDDDDGQTYADPRDERDRRIHEE